MKGSNRGFNKDSAVPVYPGPEQPYSLGRKINAVVAFYPCKPVRAVPPGIGQTVGRYQFKQRKFKLLFLYQVIYLTLQKK